MIHLMIVDDEERARTGIKTLIDWQSHGVEIVAEARDGAEALEWLEHVHVDIMLTDIRMPEIDGLALIERVNALYPHIKSVIMSGYNDFAYAQKALTLGACDYLLKPSRRKEILETVLSLIGKIEEGRLQETNLERLKSGFRESLPLLRDKTLGRLVLMEDPPYDKLTGSLELSGLTFPYTYFGIVIVQIDNFHALQKQFSQFDIELYKYGLKNVVEETIHASYHCAAFEHHDEMIIILNTDTLLSKEEFIMLARSIQTNAQKFLNMSVSIGIGSMDESIRHLKISHMSAASALDAKYYVGPGKIIDCSEVLEDEASETLYPIVLENSVLHAIIIGDKEKIAESMKLFQQALKPETTSKDDVLKFSFALYFALYRLCIEKNMNVREIFGQDLHEMTHRLSRSSIESIHNELLDKAMKTSELLAIKKNSNKLFESILAYIGENYHKDISRETVSSEVYITPGYLSLLFKQQMKISFLEYLHKIRIEHACILLQDMSKRIGDIALEVGYNDEKYFFQVFKKYTGMTPNQYRNNTMTTKR